MCHEGISAAQSWLGVVREGRFAICSGSSKRRPKSARNRGSQRLKPSGTRSRNNWRSLGKWRGMLIEFHCSRAILSPHFAGIVSLEPYRPAFDADGYHTPTTRTQHPPSIRWRTPLPTRLRTSAWDCRTWINGGRTTCKLRIENGTILRLVSTSIRHEERYGERDEFVMHTTSILVLLLCVSLQLDTDRVDRDRDGAHFFFRAISFAGTFRSAVQRQIKLSLFSQVHIV